MLSKHKAGGNTPLVTSKCSEGVRTFKSIKLITDVLFFILARAFVTVVPYNKSNQMEIKND